MPSQKTTGFTFNKRIEGLTLGWEIEYNKLQGGIMYLQNKSISEEKNV